VLFRFYCDESYDGNPQNPNILTISGFFSDQPTWDKVEKNWNEINHRYGVSCFHATDLNCLKKEYNKWSRKKGDCYSAELLKSINCQKKKMVAYNCGMSGDEYRKIINDDGRRKLGDPWIACFKSCLAMIAKDMEISILPSDYRFSVVVEKGSGFETKATDIFENLLVKNQKFEYRDRLIPNISVESKKVVGLQVADLMAYEYFKRIKDKEKKIKKRIPLELIQEHNQYREGFFGGETFMDMKDRIESAECEPDQLVIIPNL